MKRVKSLIGSPVKTVGWFRRGLVSWMDLIQLENQNGTIINSYHRFDSWVWGSVLIILGILLFSLSPI